MAIFILLAAALRSGVGTDTSAYIQIYSSLELLSYSSNMSLFYTFFYSLKPFFQSPYTITVGTAIIQIAIIFIIGRDSRYTIFLVLYIPFFLVTYSFNQVRQGLADLVAVLFFSLPMLLNKNILSSLFVGSIHPVSGCVRIVIGYWNIINTRNNFKVLFFIFACLLIVFYFSDYENHILLARYLDYFEDSLDTNPDGLQSFSAYPYFYLKTLILIMVISYGYTGRYLNLNFLSLYIFLIILVSIFPIGNRVVDSITINLMALLAAQEKLGKNIPRSILSIAVFIGLAGTLRFMWKNDGMDASCAKWLPYETFYNSLECQF